jgi:hypothetical protein
MFFKILAKAEGFEARYCCPTSSQPEKFSSDIFYAISYMPNLLF